MAKKPGSLWVEGAELHYIDVAGNEWYLKGDLGGRSGAKPGALWVETDGYLCYVGADGLKYRVWWQINHIDAASTKANVWIAGNYLYHSYGGTKYWEHGDYSHSDGTSGHTDVPHGDGHTDGAHGDSHTDSHTDSSHGDSHVDVAHDDIGHDDGHSDWFHSTGKHTDGYNIHTVNPPPTSSHVDEHYDEYGTGGTNYVHGDIHWDTHTDGPHGDTHSDGSHGDSHNDVAHQDGSHGDSHSDTVHQDATHGDGAGSHLDTPAYIGP